MFKFVSTTHCVYFFIILISLSSCGYLFYNYRAHLIVNYLLIDDKKNVNRYKEPSMIILENASKSHFYIIDYNEKKDSIRLYGPDYHEVKINIRELNEDSTIIKVEYFGYNGNRKNPPLKLFFKNIDDSLKLNYNAIKTVIKDLNNEKK